MRTSTFIFLGLVVAMVSADLTADLAAWFGIPKHKIRTPGYTCKIRGETVLLWKSKLTNDCAWKLTCNTGLKATEEKFSCPANTECRGKRCVCQAGMQKVKGDPLVDQCKEKDCQVDGQVLKAGEKMFTNACNELKVCSKGVASTIVNATCHENSRCDCESQRCVCEQGFEVARLEHGGLVPVCQKKVCKLNGKTLEEGQVVLSKDCSTHHVCRLGEVEDTEFQCPADTRCHHFGRCVCKLGFAKTGETLLGLATVERCEKRKSCRYHGKNILHGEARFEHHNCAARIECHDGKSFRTTNFQCPKSTTCDNGVKRCVCQAGYEKLGQDLDRIDFCRENVCYVDGKKLKEGQGVVSNDCKKRYVCSSSGEVEETKFECPEHNYCNLKGKCYCSVGYVLNRVGGECIRWKGLKS